MNTDTPGREKTYLILFSFLIIANIFVPITFDKINILGNEASVPDFFVKTTLVIVWLYFLWIFYQKTHWKFKERHRSRIFTNVLQEYAANKLDEYAIKSGLYNSKDELVLPGEGHLKSPLSYHGCKRVKKGFEIISELSSGFPDEEKHVMTIPSREIWGVLFLANVVYIIRDSSFSNHTFPYVIAAFASFSLIYQVLKIAIS